MRIGISIFPPKEGLSFWSNGGHQNVAFLWLLFSTAGFDVVMINGGDGEPPRPEELPAKLRAMTFARPVDVVDSLDVIIEAGAQLEAGIIDRVRERGGKAIAFKFGNNLAIDAERTVNNSPHNGGIFNGSTFDEVWTTEQHAPMCAGYWETCYRCPVRVLPHIWDPCFVDAMVATFPPGLVAGYQPVRAKKRIVIAEPNINTVKTSHIPMLIAERVWRERPDLIDRVLVTNAIHLRHRLHFETFVGTLDIAKSKAGDGAPVMSFEARYRLPWIMAAHGDVLCSHCWIDTPNYLHYDTLHLGFPLVHNITGMPGYRYEGFDVAGGARALVEAMMSGEDVNYGARPFLDARLATAPHNIDAHVRALHEVTGS